MKGQTRKRLVVRDGAASSFAAQMKRLPGIFVYWPFNETTGTVAANALGNAALNGSYVNAIQLNQIAFPTAIGGAGPLWPGSGTQNTTLPFAAIAPLWSYQQGWILMWFKQDAVTTGKQVITADGGQTYIYAHTATTDGSSRCSSPAASSDYGQRFVDWTMLATTWKANVGFVTYHQGTKLISVPYANPAGTVLTASLGLGRINGYKGSIMHLALGAGSLPTDKQFDDLYKAVYPTTHRSIFLTGDSWCNDQTDMWIDALVANLRGSDGNAWREHPNRVGYSGRKVDWWAANLSADYNPITQPTIIGVHITTNDITAGTSEAVVKANLTAGINILRAKSPGALIYLEQPYRDDNRNGSYDAACLTMKQWILDVIATYSSGVYAGPDCNTWFKGANIDTYSSDRIHVDLEPGRAACAAAWQTALGY